MNNVKVKTVLFVPGYQEDINSRDYAKTIRIIEEAGYKVEFVEINWLRTTIVDWVHQLNSTYDEYDPKDTILAGFSFGAMTAFMAAASRSPSELWLFSLSPFFNEDITGASFRKSWLRQIGLRRENSFKELNFTELIKRIKSPAAYFYGEAELKTWSDIGYRHKALKSERQAKTIFIPSAKHDVTSDAYIESISKFAKKVNLSYDTTNL